jgi:hypothetical protein
MRDSVSWRVIGGLEVIVALLASPRYFWIVG